MSQPAPEKNMQCSHCGTLFRGNPQSQPIGRDNYCSIMCEEGKAPRSVEDPQSPEFPEFLKDEPTALVGYTVLARGRKLCDYSPDWHRNPDDYGYNVIVWHDPERTLFVKRHIVVLGKVVDYDGSHYIVEHENRETGEVTERPIRDTDMLHQIRRDAWWAE